MRLFSWQGYAGRKEFFGFWIMPLGVCFGVFFLSHFLGMSDEQETQPFKEFFVLGAFALLAGIIHLFAAIRRLRHIGWPTWWASLFLAPGISKWAAFFTFVLELLLLFVPGLAGKKEDEPTYLKPNLILGVSGILVVAVILGGLIVNRQIKIHQIREQRKEEINLTRQHYSQGIRTPTQIPSDIIQPKEVSRGIPSVRTKPMPMQLPAPKVVVVADRIAWKRPADDCDNTCQKVFPQDNRCKQYLSADGKAHLCVHLWHKPGFPFEYHQILVDPNEQITEYVVFNYDKRPVLLGHFRDNQLKELFYGSSADETYFFHLAKEGFVPDFTNYNHLPTPQYADVSILLTSPQTWVPVDFDEQGRSSRSTSERELTTPWHGFNVSNQFLQ